VPDGNPPSGVAAGYVWFDVMALLVAPMLLRGARGVMGRRRHDATARAAGVELAEHHRDELPAPRVPAFALPHHPLVRAGMPDEPGERVVASDRPHTP
jgi:hypothetical protein